jgi:heat shock protein HslJ
LKNAARFAALAAAVLLTTACGASREAAGPTTDTPAATAAAVVRTLQVAPSRVECTGVGPQMCLQVRESAEGSWTRLYDAIVGFEYEPGYLYEIRIREEAVANPPADGSSIRRTLVSILSKTPAPPSLVGPTWRLVTLEGRPVLTGTRVTAVFADDDRVAGSGGCNRYFGGAQAAGETLTVGRLGTTLMYCGADDTVMRQEAAYYAALETAKAYRIVGAELQLAPAPGAVTLSYRAE